MMILRRTLRVCWWLVEGAAEAHVWANDGAGTTATRSLSGPGRLRAAPDCSTPARGTGLTHVRPSLPSAGIHGDALVIFRAGQAAHDAAPSPGSALANAPDRPMTPRTTCAKDSAPVRRTSTRGPQSQAARAKAPLRDHERDRGAPQHARPPARAERPPPHTGDAPPRTPERDLIRGVSQCLGVPRPQT